MSSSDQLSLEPITPYVKPLSSLDRTQKRKKRRSNQGNSTDDSVKVTPIKIRKSKSLIGISNDDAPRGRKSKLRGAPGSSYQQRKSGNGTSSLSESTDGEAKTVLAYQSSAVGGSLNPTKQSQLHPDDISKPAPTGMVFRRTSTVGKTDVPQDLPYDPFLMASQCRRVINYPSKLGQIAEIGRFKELISGKDPIHGKSSNVLCSSKVSGVKRKKYQKMEDGWTAETSRVFNQTARIAAVVQARTVGITFDAIKEYKEQVPDMYLMFKSAFNPDGWD